MHRYEWRRRIEQLDPVTEYHEIYRIMVAHEFPWDMNQALSFALFRTYAVPTIGGLLARTGEFLERTQQRYDDTTLILDAVVEHGFGHMNIKAIPATYQDFIALADAYEREHFGFDEGGRAVAESTLTLLATFPPSDRIPAPLVRRASFALMDDPLLDAFGFPRPNPLVRALVRAGLAARGRVVRVLPPRTEPRYARQLPNLRSYPDGYDVAQLGTFPHRHAD